MSPLDTDLVALVLRVVVGSTFIAHGYNHGSGAGGLAGTARWFAGIGLRRPRLQAWVSTWLEMVAGAALVVGVATPVAAAGLIGIMVTAGVTVHRTHGFFIFRDGYEYVLIVTTALTCLATIGPGRVSIDHLLGTFVHGWPVGLAAVVAGALGSVGMLAVYWRPGDTAEPS